MGCLIQRPKLRGLFLFSYGLLPTGFCTGKYPPAKYPPARMDFHKYKIWCFIEIQRPPCLKQNNNKIEFDYSIQNKNLSK